MERPVSVLPLGIALLFGAATFVAVNPPPAFRLIRYDEVAVNVSDFANPCLKDIEAKVKSPACHQPRQRPAKSLKSPPQYKMADPFWDRA